MKKTLYVSDLDGTLLDNNASLSDFTIETINELIHKGMHFTVATARSAASIKEILKPIHFNIPVILMNGVVIYDVAKQKYLEIQYLNEDSLANIFGVLNQLNLSGFLYEVKEQNLTTYYENLDSKPMYDFYEERVTKYGKTFKQANRLTEVNKEHIIYYTLLDRKENLEPAYEMLKNHPDIAMAFYRETYSQEELWFLEIFSSKATKFNAVNTLRTKYNYDNIVGFGDNLNDLPLFKACDETCAVANAKEELKTVADHLIESNVNHGVANWLRRNFI